VPPRGRSRSLACTAVPISRSSMLISMPRGSGWPRPRPRSALPTNGRISPSAGRGVTDRVIAFSPLRLGTRAHLVSSFRSARTRIQHFSDERCN
jgi:hypothetical protein